MKKKLFYLSISFVLILLSCSLDNPWIGQDDSGQPALPQDQSADMLRSYDSSFSFATLLPVTLKLKVNLYDPHSVESALQSLPPDNYTIIVTLHDNAGNPVYSGRVQNDGTLSTILSLPAAYQDMVLSLYAEGFEDRSVVITDMVRYSEINRTISMMLKDTGLKNILTTGTAADRDGDLVPDVYDAFPDDLTRAFSVTILADGSPLTIAFEDLFLQAQAGDADYNDFLARYTVTEILDGDNKLVELNGWAKAAVKLAGYNHLFGMVIDFSGQATLSVTYKDQNGLALPGGISNLPLSEKANIVLFPSTEDNIGYETEFTLSFAPHLEQDQVSRSPYDPYLYVYKTGFDIHLIGQEPLTGSNNSVDTFQDAEGFPWALLVPSDWQHPPETVRIETVYPLFTQWRESFGAAASDWYLFPYDATNQPPDPVTGPSTNKTYIAASGTKYYQLSLLDVDNDGQDDPDGDQVFFRSSSNLPSYMSLDEDTGEVTIEPPATVDTVIVDFWSVDEHGADTSGTPFTVTFKIIS